MTLGHQNFQISLNRVEGLLREYHRNVLYMRQREERMRQTNDSTGFRVIGFCVMSVLLMLIVTAWQVHLAIL